VGRITFGATYVYTASQLAVSRVNPFAVLPSSDLLNLNASWTQIVGQPIDLNLFVTNVTNEKVFLNIGSGYSSIGTESVLPGAPRIWGVRLKYRFGN